MHPLLRSHLLPLVVATTLAGPAAHAQLLLSGNVTGMFTDSSSANTTVYNAPDNSYNSFESGIPYYGGDPATTIEFWKQSFTDIGPGLVADDLFKVTNGLNERNSTAGAAHFNLTLNLTDPEASNHLLAIPFTITNTKDEPYAPVDDAYTLSAGSIAPFVVDGYRVQFTFNAPHSFTVSERDSAYVGSLWVTFTPVPEASTFALAGAALLAGLIVYRTISRRRTPIDSSTA
jgi:hypothetical protein